MPTTPAARSGFHAVTRAAIRAQIAERSVILLDERGFDETTVEELASAVGISPRTFFRYFPTKEDAVIGDLMPLGNLLKEELLSRPDGEEAWTALRRCLQPLEKITERDPEGVLRSTRVALSTAGLRARTIERHSAWAELLVPVLMPRLGGDVKFTTITANALTQSALACLYVATVAWVAGAGRDSYHDLLDVSFGSVRPVEPEQKGA